MMNDGRLLLQMRIRFHLAGQILQIKTRSSLIITRGTRSIRCGYDATRIGANSRIASASAACGINQTTTFFDCRLCQLLSHVSHIVRNAFASLAGRHSTAQHKQLIQIRWRRRRRRGLTSMNSTVTGSSKTAWRTAITQRCTNITTLLRQFSTYSLSSGVCSCVCRSM